MGPCLREEEDVGLKQGDGNVPGTEGLAQVLDQLRGQLGLGLAQRYALQQCLQSRLITQRVVHNTVIDLDKLERKSCALTMLDA